jgi:hypothetical protein
LLVSSTIWWARHKVSLHLPLTNVRESLLTPNDNMRRHYWRFSIITPRKALGLECNIDAEFAGGWCKETSQDPACLLSRSGYVIRLWLSNPMGQQIADRDSPFYNWEWIDRPKPSHAWGCTSIRHLWTYQQHAEVSGTETYHEVYHLRRQWWSSWACYSFKDVTSHKTYWDQASTLSQQSRLRPDPDPTRRHQKSSRRDTYQGPA